MILFNFDPLIFPILFLGSLLTFKKYLGKWKDDNDLIIIFKFTISSFIII